MSLASGWGFFSAFLGKFFTFGCSMIDSDHIQSLNHAPNSAGWWKTAFQSQTNDEGSSSDSLLIYLHVSFLWGWWWNPSCWWGKQRPAAKLPPYYLKLLFWAGGDASAGGWGSFIPHQPKFWDYCRLWILPLIYLFISDWFTIFICAVFMAN